MRRSAEELDFALPDEEVNEIWRVFDAQPREIQADMIERFEWSACGGGVGEEARGRLR